MQTPWFFATTPMPSLPRDLRPARRASGRTAKKAWWTRAAEHLEAWGERSQRRRIASLRVL